jgi:GDP-D-mannose 3', 5'-epimerase
MKEALVLGAGGFIGSHLVKRLKQKGFWVRGVDLKLPEFSETEADEFIEGDLRDPKLVEFVFGRRFDEVYQLAADMGGAGYIFTGDNDANVMHNSALINLNVTHFATLSKVKKVFYSSSACIYPEHNQLDPNNPNCEESSAYPANPDSEYGWEKLFSERLFMSFGRNYNLDVRIARFHNIFGPESTFEGGKEKAPAALCRKVAEAQEGGTIEVWGDGAQTRSFLFIDECIDGIFALMNSTYKQPVNIGSEEMISINDLAKTIIQLSGKNLTIKNIKGPEGVRGRNSDNNLVQEVTGWSPSMTLKQGLEKTYSWVNKQI